MTPRSKLGSGEVVPAAGAHWLAPVTPGATIFALGLNYGDHAKELGFKQKEPPLVFFERPECAGRAFGQNGTSG